MKTHERKADTRGQGKTEEAQTSASAGVEARLSDTAADLQIIRAFFGMSTHSLQTLWDLCRGEDRAFYRQQVASLADITRSMRNRRTF
ncbi:MAG: hypothetical protein M0Z68_03360 [Gammaproteobacteria bacterium]|nr:hypothetical protein [Gammaproteobacteria bacterium]